MWPFGNFATADFHQIWSRNVFRCPVAESGKTVSKIFTLGIICPQNLKLKIGQTGTSLKGHVIYCLLHVVVQGPRSFQDRSTFLYNVRLWSYGASNLPSFRILAYFPHTNPWNEPSGDQVTAQWLHRRMIQIFPCGSRRSKGVPSGTGDFLRLLIEELGIPQTCPNFRLWQMAIPIHNATTRDVRSGPKMSAKRACSPKQLLVNKCFVWNSMPNYIEKLHTVYLKLYKPKL